jgi:zinc protease
MTKPRIAALFLLSFVLLATGCQQFTPQQQFKIEAETYTLDNGLEVILHQDKSDPITAVALQFHVGSNRETPGHTGLAHLFEHMMFQESQHVGQDQFFKNIQAAGGTLNGGTGPDSTTYFEVVPNNALEMVLWMEADRMGYLLSRVTQEAFVNQQNVVQNEKRQVVDNRPYGHTNYVIGKLLYPEAHPYNWTVIGSMEDLTNASLKDVHAFHQQWYRPGNATLVVAGDFDSIETKGLIEKYFGEIPAGEPVADPVAIPVELPETKRAFHEDNFAQAPELNMVFPTVEEYHEDMYALDLLGDLFARGKKAPLYKVIVEEKKLAPSASGYNMSSEIAGTFSISVRAFPKTGLTQVEEAIGEAFARFETDRFTEKDLNRIKIRVRTAFFNQISSVLYKAFTLAQYNEYAGSPDYIAEYVKRLLAVTSDDVWRVYNKYLKDKAYVLTSFVPKGQLDLVAKESERFPVKEESAQDQTEVQTAQATPADVDISDIASSFDRSVMPASGPTPGVTLPDIWEGQTANGIKVLGIAHHELPLVQLRIRIQGGMLLDEPGKEGQAALTASLMNEGTRNKTPIELQEAIDDLGASIRISGGAEATSLSARCLVSELDQVVDLVREILLEPRWDSKEFDRLKQRTLESIRRSKDNPSYVADIVFDKLAYGHEYKLAGRVQGTTASVNGLSVDDLKRYYARNMSPSVADIAIAGDLSQAQALKVFARLEAWEGQAVDLPKLPQPKKPAQTQLYFVDFPDAKQSQLRIGHLAPAYTHPDYFGATVMNYKLGGSFNSTLNMILREEKGYTYGARSSFSGSHYPGTFSASSGVRSTATVDSLRIVREELAKYRQGIPAEDLQFTKDALTKSNTRAFETLGALLNMLNRIATYDLPHNYIKQREQVVQGMTLTEHKRLAQQYIHPDKTIYLVVGDAKTQLGELKGLDLGEPILLDKDGKVVEGSEGK